MASLPLDKRPLRVFISYSHLDIIEKSSIVHALQAAQTRFEILSDHLLLPGDDWNPVLRKMREDAEAFLLLVSPAYLSSKTIQALEMEHIMQRAEHGATVIPVILTACNWTEKPFARFQGLPKFGRPIDSFPTRGAAYAEIIEALESLSELRTNPEVVLRITAAKRRQDRELDLSNLNLSRIPRDLLEMPWLTHLYLQRNAIGDIENLENLTALSHLNLSYNKLIAVRNLDRLESLRHLDLEHNVLMEIGGLERNLQLEELGLSSNLISELGGITHLKKLKTLYASQNLLTGTEALRSLPGLHRIVLSDNQITSIRPLEEHLTRIQLSMDYALKKDAPGIFVRGNPIADPPIEVLGFGNQAILDHFRKSRTYGDKNLEVLKLILIGNSGVGKTNFSQHLRRQRLNKDHESTDTLDIRTWEAPFLKTMTGKRMRVNIFDFGGQDYYHDLHRLYYSHDAAYVLLWDQTTNQYSERTEQLSDATEISYENFPIEYWLESIQYNLHGKQAHIRLQSLSPDATSTPDLAATAPVLVIQNKIDCGEGMLDQAALQRKYPNIATFFNLSLHTKSRLKALNDVLSDGLRAMNLTGRRLVRYQHEIIEEYIAQQDVAFEVLPLAAFRERCVALAQPGRTEPDMQDARTIASVLTNLGSVLYDTADDTDGIVFTHIGRLNESIRAIMNKAKLGKASRKGRFRRDEVGTVAHIDSILQLLRRNGSVIALNEQDYLVPQYLPAVPDAQAAHFIKAFVHCQIRYVYTAYFHKSLVVGLFAKFIGQAEKSDSGTDTAVKAICYWRNGIVLAQETGSGSEMVFVHYIKEPAACRIEIRSLHPFRATGLEREVERELDQHNQGWSFRKEVSVNSVDYFDVDRMREQVRRKDFVFRSESAEFTVNNFKHLVRFENVPKKLFISYSSRNADFVKRFWTHLDVLRTKGDIEPWYDRKIEPGARWDENIQQEMISADMIIFLVSPDFLATQYIMEVELQKAMELEAGGTCELFFIQLLRCSWAETVLTKYQMYLDPDAASKSQFVIDTPGNDAAWTTTMQALAAKLRPA